MSLPLKVLSLNLTGDSEQRKPLYSRAELELSLDEMIELSKRLSERVAKQFSPDLIVGILTHGFLPSIEIARELDVPVEFIRLKRREENVVVLTGLEKTLEGLDILLVDDTYESGRTMRRARLYLLGKNPHALQTAVLRYDGVFENDQNAPDFFEIFRKHVAYPWGYPGHPAGQDYRKYLMDMCRTKEFGVLTPHFFNYTFPIWWKNNFHKIAKYFYVSPQK